MKEIKTERNEMNEAWDQVGKAMNDATELYMKQLGDYLGWMQNVRKEMLEHTFATNRQLWRMGEAQLAFYARMRPNFPFLAAMPKWGDFGSDSA